MIDKKREDPPIAIWLQWNSFDGEVTWCVDKINDDDILYYISKTIIDIQNEEQECTE